MAISCGGTSWAIAIAIGIALGALGWREGFFGGNDAVAVLIVGGEFFGFGFAPGFGELVHHHLAIAVFICFGEPSGDALWKPFCGG